LILPGKALGRKMKFEDISMGCVAPGAVLVLDWVLIGQHRAMGAMLSVSHAGNGGATKRVGR
jgi:hypothetical protein